MRHYGLPELMQSIRRACVRPITEGQMRNLLDVAAAVTVLRSASRVVGVHPDAGTLAKSLHDLIVNVLNTRPYKGGWGEVVLATICRDFATVYGYDLALSPAQTAEIVNKCETNSLSPRDVCRALRAALKPREGGHEEPSGLQGCLVHLVHQDVGETNDGISVVQEVEKLVEGLGARASLSPHSNSLTSLAREGVTHHELEAAGAVLSRTISLVTRSHLLVIVGTTLDPDAAAEREWALRCGIPVIELDSKNGVRPLRDGTKLVCRIPITGPLRQRAIRQLTETVHESKWRIHDQKAYAEAIVWKNESMHRHLRVAWDALTSEVRRTVASTTVMSEAYINGILSHPGALELASETQLGQLSLLLKAPRRLPFREQLTPRQRRLLGKAMADAGVTDPVHVLEIYSRAEHRFTDSERYSRLVSDADAQVVLSDIVSDMELEEG